MFGNNLVYRSSTRHLRVQGLQILLMGDVSVTSASQILESFCNILSQVTQRKQKTV